jgi:hypothetical protein
MLISVFRDQIRTDQVRRYEGAIEELASEARRKDEAWRWTAHAVAFGPQARIYYVSQHPDYADLERHGDPAALFGRVLGESKGQKRLEEATACLLASERTLAQRRDDLSHPRQPAGGLAPLASVALLRARPGQQAAVEEFVRSLAEAIPKTGEEAALGAAQVIVGDMLAYWLVRPLQRLADLDRQTTGRDLLLRAYGQTEGERIFRAGTEGIQEIQREIVAYREELSNPPR